MKFQSRVLWVKIPVIPEKANVAVMSKIDVIKYFMIKKCNTGFPLNCKKVVKDYFLIPALVLVETQVFIMNLSI